VSVPLLEERRHKYWVYMSALCLLSLFTLACFAFLLSFFFSSLCLYCLLVFARGGRACLSKSLSRFSSFSAKISSAVSISSSVGIVEPYSIPNVGAAQLQPGLLKRLRALQKATPQSFMWAGLRPARIALIKHVVLQKYQRVWLQYAYPDTDQETAAFFFDTRAA
jgi:hypothetical protein